MWELDQWRYVANEETVPILILIYSVVVLVGVTLVVMDSFNLNFSLVFGNLSQAFHFLLTWFCGSEFAHFALYSLGNCQ